MPTARPTLNFDAPEPVVTTDPNASALFPSQPVYARTPKKKTSGNLPLLVGVPILAVAAGALIWGMTANRAEAPTDPASMQTAVADTRATAPVSQPTEVAVNEPAPAPVARSAEPRAAAPARPVARRAAPAPEAAPSADTASANVSATVPAAPPTVTAAPAAPAIAEPAPLVIPAPSAPAPTPAPAQPM